MPSRSGARALLLAPLLLLRATLPLASQDAGPGQSNAESWVEVTLGELTLRQKVGQMIVPWVLGDFSPADSEEFERISQLIAEHEIGGLLVSNGTPLDVAAKLNVFQRQSRLPLLVAADLETGAGLRLRGAVHLPGGTDLGGATDFPSLMALGATGDRYLAYEMGRITAEEARAVGIHIPFAPVLDVNSNPENPIINTRSFGEDPDLVAGLGACLLRGIQDYGAIATAKHFPGHGDTDTDSHLALPIIRAGMDRLDRTELVPFRAAVGAGVGAIMTAHIALPEIAEAANLPATLSRNVLTGLLREELGFEGLIFTDAMDMDAIDRLFPGEEAAVRAVEAGADVILLPPSPEVAIRGIMSAVLSGRIPEERINASVERILRAKAAMGLHQERTVDLEAIHRRLGLSGSREVAQEIANRSITLLTNGRNLLPLVGTRSANVLSVSYRRANDLLAGRFFNGRLRETYPQLQTAVVGADTPREEYQRLLTRARSADLVVLSLYITAVSSSGTVAAPEDLVEFIEAVARSERPNVVVSFGNPYLLGDFPGVQAYLLAWSGAESSQLAAARALFGEVRIQGRTPTRIPPDFAIGAGIELVGLRVAESAIEGECG
ncbi:MAG: glycoside hydrolase family 3 N-terminal domain-containing protein [Gemmatimonadota bacterium]